MTIKQVFQKNFPENSICVLTREPISDVIKIGLSMAWIASYSRAKKCDYFVGISINDLSRGQYFIAGIKEVISMADVKRNNCNHENYPTMEAHEYAALKKGSTFYGDNKFHIRDGDDRLVFIFNENITRGVLVDKFRSSGGVVFYT